MPPFPHPLPERRIGIRPTEHGLLVYPRSSAHANNHQHTHPPHKPHHFKSSTTAAASNSRSFGSGDGFKVATLGSSNAAALSTANAPLIADGAIPTVTSLDVGFLIQWGKQANITSLPPSSWKSVLEQANQDDPTLECSGIVGLSRFFNSSYLFVITNSKLVGHYFHETRPIYCCTGVLAIPLLREEASQAIRAQIARMGSAPVQPSSNPDQDDNSFGDVTMQRSNSASECDSSESDDDDVQTPAAIPKEHFFSSVSSSGRADTFHLPRSRPWLTRAARSVSDGRIEAISEDPVAQSQIADATLPAGQDALQPSPAPQSPEEIETSAQSKAPVTADELWHAAKQAELEDKAVRETAKYWARGEFWFSYDFDLTTSLQNKRKALESNNKPRSAGTSQPASVATINPTQTSKNQHEVTSAQQAATFPLLAEPYPHLPLWRRADRRFWHNEHMSKDLIHAGLHAYILPVMQGYLQTVALPVQSAAQNVHNTDDSDSGVKDDDAVLGCQMMVISRRSKERAGLRYQRRGINESGQVANFVETEQILYILRSQPSSKLTGDVLSFVQIRGSIPLYWSQSPFSLKPPPVLERTDAENTEACRRHFSVQVDRYGSITCVNLAEQGGKEGCISKAYRSAVENLCAEDPANDAGAKVWDRTKLHYVDFDFHKECSGMRFENVAKLIEQMAETLGEMKYYHHTTDGDGKGVEVLSRQTGVFRVSCLDCLDRTNVVQSALARHVLAGQLAKLGISVGSAEPANAAAA